MNRRRILGLLASLSLPFSLPTVARAQMSGRDKQLFKDQTKQLAGILEAYLGQKGWVDNGELVDGILDAAEQYILYIEGAIGVFDAATAAQAITELQALDGVLQHIESSLGGGARSSEEAAKRYFRVRDLRHRLRALVERLEAIA